MQVGRHQNSFSHRSRSCSQCPLGRHEPQRGQSVCRTCSTGRYQDARGQTSCKACPSGEYQDLNIQTTCKTCSAGEYSMGGESSCRDCPGKRSFGRLCVARGGTSRSIHFLLLFSQPEKQVRRDRTLAVSVQVGNTALCEPVAELVVLDRFQTFPKKRVSFATNTHI